MDYSKRTKKQLLDELLELKNNREESPEIYQSLINNAIVGIFKTTIQGELKFCNNALIKMLEHKSQEDIENLKLKKIFKDPSVIHHFINVLTTKGKINNFEVELLTRTGKIITVFMNATLEGENVIGMFLDISSRKEIEKAFEESEHRYRNLFESANDAIIISDADKGYVIDANRKAEELLGMPAIEIIGKHHTELHPEKKREEYAKGYRESSNKNTSTSGELFIVTKKGKKVAVEISSSIIEIDGKRLKQGIFRDLSERKKAEEALRSSEDKYKELIENINDVIYSVDKNGIITYMSPVVKSVIGFEPEQLIGNHFAKYIFKDDLPLILKSFKEVLNNQLEPREYRLLTSEGTYIWVRSSSKPVYVKGEVIGIQGVIMNINSIRQVEEKHRSVEGKYQNLIDNIPDAIAELDDEGKFTYLSPKVNDMFGYEPDELVGSSAIDFVHPDDLEKTIEAMINAFSNESYKELEYRGKHKNGHYIPLSSSGRIFKENGKIKLVGIIRDVTEQKKAERALRDSEEKFRLLFQNASEGIIYIDYDGEIQDANPKVYEITNLEKDDLVGKNFIDLIEVFKVGDENLMTSFESMISGKQQEKSEWKIMNKKGETRVIMANPALVWKDREVVGINVILEDITERKKTEDDMIQERKRAQLYLDILSHDIKNLDQVIITSSELMLLQDDLSEKNRNHVQNSLAQAEAISDLISNLKKVTTLKDEDLAGKGVNVRKMMERSISLLNSNFPDRKISINHDIEDTDVFVAGNELLQYVFDNILTNAVKFNPNENVEINITYAPEPDGKFWRLIFSDNGTGISDNMKERIFDRSERGEGSVPGSGLGLTIAHEVISRFGGKVWIEDREEKDHRKGANFVILLQKVQTINN